MKTTRLALPSLALAALVVASPSFARAQTGPIRIEDVPRATQIGQPPAPAGAGRYLPPLPADPKLPTLWLIGDSTVRNGTAGDNGPAGQWGWGAPLTVFFDLRKLNVVNRAMGGTSSRTFYRDFFWRDLKPRLKAGDFVILQFGANDNGGAKGKGALPGVGDETEANGDETVHSFGWYLKQFVAETRAAGATPIICSLTPRKGWAEDGKFRRNDQTHAAWAQAVARETDVPFVPLYELIARRYESLGKEKVDAMFVPTPKESLHTGWDGAVVNAECVVAGLKALPANPLAPYFSERAQAIAPVDATTRPAE